MVFMYVFEEIDGIRRLQAFAISWGLGFFLLAVVFGAAAALR